MPLAAGEKKRKRGTGDCVGANAVAAEDTAVSTADAEHSPHNSQQQDVRQLHRGPEHPSPGSAAEHRDESGEEDADQDIALERGVHPYGVQPLGNQYAADVPSCRGPGLGLFAVLSDELVLAILELLSAKELCQLAMASRAFYAFAHHEELWKTLAIEAFPTGFWFRGSWKDTLLASLDGARTAPHKPIKVPGLFSDVLFQPWFCASMALSERWMAASNIDRRTNLSVADFKAEYEQPNIPVIITDVVTKWPAFAKWREDSLLSLYGDKPFICGPVTMTLRQFYQYAKTTTEESPLYLFDKFFAKNTSMAEDYSVPAYFADDLFAVLGEDARPHYRWVIIGGPRSGSTFHVDPNGTSAWNAVLRGRKKWIMFPPSCPPPGVFPSADGSEVTSPVSLAEWFLNFYEQCKHSPVKPREAVVEAGEVIFVPHGWWHCVQNLGSEDDEPSVAITQNFVSKCSLAHVLSFLSSRREQVSGCADGDTLYERFVEGLEREYPNLVEETLAADAARKKRRTLWEQMKHGGDPDSEGGTTDKEKSVSTGGEFSFDFGDDSDDDGDDS